jgi:Family of unknown function (DUF6941)
MKIEYVVLSDAAQAVGGKLYILGGGWTLFRAMKFPAPVQIALAMSISYTAAEAGKQFPLRIAIADEAGVPIAPELNTQVSAGPAKPDLPVDVDLRLCFAANMGLLIPRAGKYTVLVTAGPSSLVTHFTAIFVGRRLEQESGNPPERGN